MRGWWLVSALGLAACLEPGRAISLPPELGNLEALLVPPPFDAAPVLPILGQEAPQPFALTEQWSRPLDLLIYDCPLSTFGIAEVLKGPREKAAPIPASWLRLGMDDRWSPSTGPVVDRPLVPSYPRAPSECWRFEEAAVEARVEVDAPVAAVAPLDDTHLLVGDHSGRTVIYELQGGLSLFATLSEVGLVALWPDPPRRRAYWLASDGVVGVVEPAGTTWQSRRLTEVAPGFGPCIRLELTKEVVPDGDLELAGVADDDHFELMAAGRCGSLAYYNSRQGAWRGVATGTTTDEAALPRRVGVVSAGPREWWISGLPGQGLRRYVGLSQGTGPATPELVEYGDESEATALLADTDGSILIGNREGAIYRWADGRAELLTRVTDKVLALFPFRSGLVIAGENGSTVFQHQSLAPDGLCSSLDEAPQLVGVQRLHHFVPLADGRVVSVGVRPGAPEPGIYSRISLQRPSPPPAWACHRPAGG